MFVKGVGSIAAYCRIVSIEPELSVKTRTSKTFFAGLGCHPRLPSSQPCAIGWDRHRPCLQPFAATINRLEAAICSFVNSPRRMPDAGGRAHGANVQLKVSSKFMDVHLLPMVCWCGQRT
jgi:hypothetical protein